jgi:predicted metal-binding protein
MARQSRGTARKTAGKSGSNASAQQPVTLYVCRSCVWSEAQRERDGQRQGEFLLAAIKREITRKPLPENSGMRAVHCLNGCKSPCNVAFRSPGKHGLRFSHLTPDNATEVLAFLEAYRDSDVGDVAEEDVPEGLRGKLTVRTPPPPIRAR